MKRGVLTAAVLTALAGVMSIGCGSSAKASLPKDEAPPPAQVEKAPDVNLVKVEHAEQFPLVAAERYDAAAELSVTGTVSPDVSRNIPVISLASGRVLEIHGRLGDTVTKGQLLLKVQSSDISGAFSEYRQAKADAALAQAQLQRSKLLLDQGAIAQKDYEVAVDADLKAKVTVETTEEHLRVLGADKDHPSAIIDIFAPASGVITDQQVTQSAGVQSLSGTNPFTISDLSNVWILCDVYENDLKNVRVGEFADIRLNAYPDQTLRGKISNIGPILDPTLRTAKVRLEVSNPGMMRIGMFVTATFHGMEKQAHEMVPSSAVLHLHDRDWIYVSTGGNAYRRVEVAGGRMLPGNMQEVSGITPGDLKPGDQIVRNALVLQNTVEQ